MLNRIYINKNTHRPNIVKLLSANSKRKIFKAVKEERHNDMMNIWLFIKNKRQEGNGMTSSKC